MNKDTFGIKNKNIKNSKEFFKTTLPKIFIPKRCIKDAYKRNYCRRFFLYSLRNIGIKTKYSFLNQKKICIPTISIYQLLNNKSIKFDTLALRKILYHYLLKHQQPKRVLN